MSHKSKKRHTGRRSRVAAAALIIFGLMLTGGIYAGAATALNGSDKATTQSAVNLEDGKKLFQANCATCHGMQIEGTDAAPSLYGAGELGVYFQVSTGRMPLAANAPQAPAKDVQFTDQQIRDMAAWVQSLSPGPTMPDPKVIDGKGDLANGAELFRVNCAMCHNVAGAGGALTAGKYAPNLHTVSATDIYGAMETGPENMPIFNNQNLTPDEKRDIISSVLWQQQNKSAGGFSLGDLGPVSEGLFIWIFGIGALIALAVWITAKSN